VARAARAEDARAADAQHCENARAVAEFLDGTRASSACSTPACRPSGPRARRAADARLRRDGLVPRRVRGGGVALVARTKIWKLAESLGGVESLIEVPRG
jgi:cystathionine gamma-synthase